MTNEELANSGQGGRVRYKTPASRLWVENELRKRDARIDTLQKQNTRITKQNNRLLVARERYDKITLERRKARGLFQSKMWNRVDAMWRAYTRADSEAQAGPAEPAVMPPPSAPVTVSSLAGM